jgi:hypothetical protein
LEEEVVAQQRRRTTRFIMGSQLGGLEDLEGELEELQLSMVFPMLRGQAAVLAVAALVDMAAQALVVLAVLLEAAELQVHSIPPPQVVVVAL